MLNRKKLLLILDYDGCGDALFRYRNSSLWTFIKELAKEYDLEFYCGSIRQTQFINKFLAIQNKNGCCFTNYENLCKSNNWKFNKLLLPDVEQKLAPGTAMNDPTITCELDEIFLSPRSRNNHAISPLDQRKLDIIKGQLQDAKKNYPNQELLVYFVDDKNEIHDYLIKTLSSCIPDKMAVKLFWDNEYGIQHYHTFAKTKDENIDRLLLPVREEIKNLENKIRKNLMENPHLDKKYQVRNQKAALLFYKLRAAVSEYVYNNDAQFLKKTCQKHIKAVRPIVSEHRGIKGLLKPSFKTFVMFLFLCRIAGLLHLKLTGNAYFCKPKTLLSLGATFLLGGIINKNITGSPFFLKTETLSIIDKINDEISKIDSQKNLSA